MNTSQVKRRLAVPLACAFAASFVALSSAACAESTLKESANGTNISMKVQYKTSELATESGLDQVYRRIKGAARLVGADTLGRCVAEIEAAARTPTQELPPLEPLHAAIRSLRWWHASGN